MHLTLKKCLKAWKPSNLLLLPCWANWNHINQVSIMTNIIHLNTIVHQEQACARHTTAGLSCNGDCSWLSNSRTSYRILWAKCMCKITGLEAHSASGTPHRVAGKWKKTFVKEHWSQETARDNSYCRWIVSWVLPLGQEQRGHTAPWVPLQRREGPCVGLWGDLLAPMV